MESIGVESIGVVGVVGVCTPEKSAHNTRHSTPNLHTQRDCPTITYEFRGGQNSKKLTKSGLPKGSSGRKSLHFHQLYD